MTHCTSSRLLVRANLFATVAFALGRSDKNGDGYTNVGEFLSDGL